MESKETKYIPKYLRRVGITYTQLVDFKCRKKDICDKRHVVIYMEVFEGVTPTRLAKLLNCHKSTITRSVKRFSELYNVDAEFRTFVNNKFKVKARRLG